MKKWKVWVTLIISIVLIFGTYVISSNNEVSQVDNSTKTENIAIEVKGFSRYLSTEDQYFKNEAHNNFTHRNAADYYIKAYNYMINENYSEAVKALKMSITLEPQNTGSYSLLSTAYQGMEKKELSKKALEDCLKIDPINETCLNGLGLFYRLDNPKKALKIFNKALSLTEVHHAEIYFNIALTYATMQNFDSACLFIDKVKEYNPGQNLDYVNKLSETIQCENRTILNQVNLLNKEAL